MHSEVNRIFANSTFGALEEVEGDRRDVMRRTVKKGPDTKGMYVLRIECRAHGPGIIGGEGGTEGKAGVEGQVSTPYSRIFISSLRTEPQTRTGASSETRIRVSQDTSFSAFRSASIRVITKETDSNDTCTT